MHPSNTHKKKRWINIDPWRMHRVHNHTTFVRMRYRIFSPSFTSVIRLICVFVLFVQFYSRICLIASHFVASVRSFIIIIICCVCVWGTRLAFFSFLRTLIRSAAYHSNQFFCNSFALPHSCLCIFSTPRGKTSLFATNYLFIYAIYLQFSHNIRVLLMFITTATN